MKGALSTFSTLLLIMSSVLLTGHNASAQPINGGLTLNFYRRNSCPQAEQIVRDVTWASVRSDPTLAPKLLRVHYHDCFVKGCDASILLDPVGSNNQTEKQAVPNLSLGGFEVIDQIKARLEKVCPKKVSCADILALAARDAVSFPFRRPLWKVFTGRKDGTASRISDVTGNLPSPFANFTILQSLFSNKGLDTTDLVALSGAHTIGVAHCGTFSRRLFNFTGKGDSDPSLDPKYAAFLKTQCTNPPILTKTVGMDPNSTLTFDPHYYVAVRNNQGLFQSDAALLTDPGSAGLVRRFQFPGFFFNQFARSMVKMGGIEVLVGGAGEIRTNCRAFN